jgi:hypothetical protein
MADKMPPTLEHFDRTTFLTEIWDYKPGEHVTVIGSTGSGKTTLAYQVLSYTNTPELPSVVLVMKPRDDTASKAIKRLKHRKVSAWPPIPSPWQPKKPSGYAVWPGHTFDPDRDEAAHYDIFRTVILDSYKKGNRILFIDETEGLKSMGLEKEMRTVWRQGRSMGCGVWAATQRPSDIPLLAYSSASHLFLFRDNDKRARERFSEIGGMDGQVVAEANLALKDHTCLYIHQPTRSMCVIEAA